MKKIRACIFDLDGVIIDTASHHFIAWCQLADEIGIPFADEHNEALKGLSRLDSLEYILNIGGMVLDSETKLRLMETKNAHYLKLVGNITPMDVLPGVMDFMEILKSKGIKVALGSSSKNAEMILRRLNLMDQFDALVDGNHITLSKPDPEVFILGAKALGIEPEYCLVFEDAQSGIDAAKAGGFPVIGIGSLAALSKADAVIAGFDGLTWDGLKALL
ncbi:MAG: beta-phosphoglucomutase [Crocinitomicaceae bacterium]|nr:beta-phosphoglucomutase [Crocinitomicaceae bacterium]|tara:strand:- start:1448 stop:2101 length:654 start_codon:yes stop_codon:yes gene_type:complete